MKRILCWLGLHDWRITITTDHFWILPDNEQLYLINLECKKCPKKTVMHKLLIQQNEEKNTRIYPAENSKM